MYEVIRHVGEAVSCQLSAVTGTHPHLLNKLKADLAASHAVIPTLSTPTEPSPRKAYASAFGRGEYNDRTWNTSSRFPAAAQFFIFPW